MKYGWSPHPVLDLSVSVTKNIELWSTARSFSFTELHGKHKFPHRFQMPSEKYITFKSLELLSIRVRSSMTMH